MQGRDPQFNYDQDSHSRVSSSNLGAAAGAGLEETDFLPDTDLPLALATTFGRTLEPAREANIFAEKRIAGQRLTGLHLYV